MGTLTYKQRWLALRRAMRVTAELAEQDYGVVLKPRHADLKAQNQHLAATLRRMLKEDTDAR